MPPTEGNRPWSAGTSPTWEGEGGAGAGATTLTDNHEEHEHDTEQST